MIVDYSKRMAEHAPILIVGAVVEQVERFKFLGVHITKKLAWSKHTKILKSDCSFDTARSTVRSIVSMIHDSIINI